MNNSKQGKQDFKNNKNAKSTKNNSTSGKQTDKKKHYKSPVKGYFFIACVAVTLLLFLGLLIDQDRIFYILAFPIRLLLQMIYFRKQDIMFLSPPSSSIILTGLFTILIYWVLNFAFDPKELKPGQFIGLALVFLLFAGVTCYQAVCLFENYAVIDKDGIYYKDFATKNFYAWGDVEAVELDCHVERGGFRTFPHDVVTYKLLFNDGMSIDLRDSIQFHNKFMVIDQYMPKTTHWYFIGNRRVYQNNFNPKERAYMDKKFF